MFRKIIQVSILSIIFFSCQQQVADYVLDTEVVEIRFTKGIQNGDWFKLDDVLFTHVMNDTTDIMNQPELNHYAYFGNVSAEFVDNGYLPSGELYYRAQEDVMNETVPTSRIAAYFIRRLYQKQMDNNPDNLIYQVGDAEFLIMSGRVFVKRSDDEKIVVTSNAPDRILFFPLLKTDKMYKSLFEKAQPAS